MENYEVQVKSLYHVSECCWKCAGTGSLVKSVGPITYQKCYICYGNRGRLRTYDEMLGNTDAI